MSALTLSSALFPYGVLIYRGARGGEVLGQGSAAVHEIRQYEIQRCSDDTEMGEGGALIPSFFSSYLLDAEGLFCPAFYMGSLGSFCRFGVLNFQRTFGGTYPVVTRHILVLCSSQE